jgi:major membrane immunogen (membrane-anchored lipoprotein)
MSIMKIQSKVVHALTIMCALSLAWPVSAQEEEKQKKAEGEKKSDGEKGEKAKGEKVSGDIGLLDTEKNYMIVVTKEGKLVTVDFDQKTKVTELKAKDAKMADIGLGSSATVQYTKKGEKNYVSGIEFTPAKGGD